MEKLFITLGGIIAACSTTALVVDGNKHRELLSEDTYLAVQQEMFRTGELKAVQRQRNMDIYRILGSTR